MCRLTEKNLNRALLNAVQKNMINLTGWLLEQGADVRFENEVKFIKRNSGILVRIDSDSRDDADQHITERGFPDRTFDYILDNSAQTEEIFTKIENMMNEEQR